MKPAVGQAIGAGIGSITDIFAQQNRFKHEQKQQEREFALNRELSEYAYSKELEQWHRANAYNAPTAQMARLREAGLNPAMIYGSGGAKTTAATLPKYQAPRANFTARPPEFTNAIANAIGMYQNWRRGQAEIKSLESEAENADRYYAYRGHSMRNRAQQQAYNLGLDIGSGVFIDKDGVVHKYANTPGAKKYVAELNNINLRNQLQQKTLDWFVANQVTNMIGKAFNILPISKGTRGIGKIRRFSPW